MLYYTSRNRTGEIDATYSGRFAFIHFRQPQEFEAVNALRRENDLKGLWAIGQDSDLNAARILAHEYTHKHIFSLSESGLVLNGLRFWVRVHFLLTGSLRRVEDYYRMRTVYFMETKPYHETLAQAIDGELAQGKGSIEEAFQNATRQHYQSSIAAAEKVIREKWDAMRLSPSGIWRAFCRWFGKWLQENFAVKLSCRDEQGGWIHGSFADQGITNDIYDPRPTETFFARIKKQILVHTLVRPLARLDRFNRQFDWYWIGQRTQYRVLQAQYNVDHDRFWKDFLCPNALFILQWAGVPAHLHSSLIELYEDTLLLDQAAFQSRWGGRIDSWKDDDDVKRYFSFFYQHGN
jgi:hypothetical protein